MNGPHVLAEQYSERILSEPILLVIHSSAQSWKEFEPLLGQRLRCHHECFFVCIV